MSPDVAQLVALIESWEKAYLPPSAMIVLRDARLKLIEQDERIADLLIEVAELNDRILAPSETPLTVSEEPVNYNLAEEKKPRARKPKGENNGQN